MQLETLLFNVTQYAGRVRRGSPLDDAERLRIVIDFFHQRGRYPLFPINIMLPIIIRLGHCVVTSVA